MRRSLIAFDEESGKERKTNEYLLVQANDVKEAYENTMHAMKDTMGDFNIPSIAESPIVDVFPYFTGEEENSERLEEFMRLKESVPADNAEVVRQLKVLNDKFDVLFDALEEMGME